MAGVDEVLKKGYVDETRMGVTGGSGGGLLTNWVVTQTTRFKAAVSQRDISDWSNFWYTADFTLFTPTWFRKAPFEDPADFAKRSPITYVAKVQTPLMFILGDEDYRTPPAAGGEELFRALKLLKRPTVMVRFPGESHEPLTLWPPVAPRRTPASTSSTCSATRMRSSTKVNGYKAKVRNQAPNTSRRTASIARRRRTISRERSSCRRCAAIDDDRIWWKLMRDTYQEFKSKNIMTEDMVRFFNEETGKNWTPIFDAYLRHASLPTLELVFNADSTVFYRWKADEKDFAMPIRVGKAGAWQTIQPTTEWKKMSTTLKQEEFEVATDLYYVNVARQQPTLQ